MGDLLNKMNLPFDLKNTDEKNLCDLASEIREFLIEKISVTGGHLASNLGVVELTIALHRSFNTPYDKIVWDVGHQSYVHKILTGRKDGFDTIRQKGGISGFPKISESEYDTFNTGHSSTAMSVALGYAAAADLSNEKREVIAVVGDSAFCGGMSFEALNHISTSGKKVTIVLNDNQMSIGKATGSLSKYLNKIRTTDGYYHLKNESKSLLDKIPHAGAKINRFITKSKRILKFAVTPGVFFEQLGYKYLGPVDGHDIHALCKVFEQAKKYNKACIVHVMTVKGKGYSNAEIAPTKYHAISGTNSLKTDKSFSETFGEAIISLANEDESIIAVSPSMASSSGLSDFSKNFPNRFFDAGIAEAHAVTFAAGMEAGGYKPVVCVYSTFLQRAYDSLIHDVALCQRHVVFAIDRAGVVGEDGETHQGVFDISYLNHIPNMTIFAPCDTYELAEMLYFAVKKCNTPVAIRYPKGSTPILKHTPFQKGKAEILREGNNVTIAAVGRMVHTALDAAKILECSGIEAEIINVRTVKPFDKDLLIKSALKTGLLVTIEDNVKTGGFGSLVADFITQNKIDIPLKIMGFPEEFIAQASVKQIMSDYKLDAEHLAQEVKNIL